MDDIYDNQQETHMTNDEFNILFNNYIKTMKDKKREIKNKNELSNILDDNLQIEYLGVT